MYVVDVTSISLCTPSFLLEQVSPTERLKEKSIVYPAECCNRGRHLISSVSPKISTSAFSNRILESLCPVTTRIENLLHGNARSEVGGDEGSGDGVYRTAVVF